MHKTQESYLYLQNNKLRVKVAMPGQVYQGSRFDWTGFIVQVTLGDQHTFCTQESFQPGVGTGGIGLCNEFGIEQVIGYEEAQIGEKFPKIGVGLLLKPDSSPYSFFRPYRIEPFPVSVDATESTALFTMQPIENNGYAMALTKSIKLKDHFIEVAYQLRNVGRKPIHTHEYNHNFVSIDNCPTGPLYQLTLPCQIAPEQIPDLLRIEGQSMSWNRTPESDFYIKVKGFDPLGSFSWELTNPTKGAGLREYNDFQIQQLAVWGRDYVISPEVFCEIKLPPGGTKCWTRTYEFFTL